MTNKVIFPKVSNPIGIGTKDTEEEESPKNSKA
jgi:hypothetical protein